jgi:hypothetical protein
MAGNGHGSDRDRPAAAPAIHTGSLRPTLAYVQYDEQLCLCSTVTQACEANYGAL